MERREELFHTTGGGIYLALRHTLLLLMLLAIAACQQGQAPADPSLAPSADTSVATEEAVATELGQEEAGAADGAAAEQSGRVPKDEAPASASADAPPAPTADPALDSWTLLIYLNADNQAAEEGLRALGEVAAAGAIRGVNVLVQVDRAPAGGEGAWSGARRYRLQAGGEGDASDPELLSELGAVNMGDPATLRDFITWGTGAYPANRYALLLSDQGGSWPDPMWDAGSADGLTAPELSLALEEALNEAGLAQLDVVALDAPLSNELALHRALQPHAHFSAALPGAASGTDAPYTTFANRLYELPEVAGDTLALEMVAAFGSVAEARSATGPVATTTAVALDLDQLEALDAALSELVDVLTSAGEQPRMVEFVTVAAARERAQPRTLFVGAGAEPAPVVDLRAFAALIADHSPHETTRAAARRVLAAAAGADLADSGIAPARGSGGLTLTFPRSAALGQQIARDGTPPYWERFLTAYWAAAAEPQPSPSLNLVYTEPVTVGVMVPAFLPFEIAGLALNDLQLLAARQEDPSRFRLLMTDLLKPNVDGEGNHLGSWRDGVHDEFVIWEARAPYVSDGSSGDFAALRALAGGELHAAAGRYRESGTEWREALLVFDMTDGRYLGMWQAPGEGRLSLWRRVRPQGEGEFQLYNLYWDGSAEGSAVSALSREAGVTLTFSAGVEPELRAEPLPNGAYRLAFVAETVGGERAVALSELTVVNSTRHDGFRAYLDPIYGFQFQYPEQWQLVVQDERTVAGRDSQSDTHLTITRHPAWESSVETLQARVLEAFGPVDILYEEAIFVAGTPGFLTAYGYDEPGEARTGLFFTFVSDGTGYVVDVDGPLTAEATTISTVDNLIASWQFRPVGMAHLPGQWSPATFGQFTLSLPEGTAPQQLENGWQLLQSGDSFVALRRDPVEGRLPGAVVSDWLHLAADGVEEFEEGDPSTAYLAGHAWTRTGFRYEGEDGPVQGFVMATISGREEVVVWAEAPAATYDEQTASFFVPIIAEAAGRLAGEPGLLYHAAFDSSSPWGAGRTEEAIGRLAGGRYRMTVTAPEGFFWTAAGQSFGDGSYVVEATQTAGPLDSGYGLLVRADAEGGRFYVLEISSDGYVWIGLCHESCAQTETLVGDGWFPSPAVRQGRGETNRLRIDAIGDRLLFYVNDIEVGRTSDATLPRGDVGLFVETLGEPGVTVGFDNVRVLSP
ncbi:MAG: clostripain-related cysteine peptidase [Candidatus Promineifilaceae bacterium]|nr:clostripain-related cysteine peptidase [Candidatus Promineifilaceae bacterium]